MIETVLITTTINVPTVLTQWATSMKAGDWIIVAGDHKSPHEDIKNLLAIIQSHTNVNCMYLHPSAQMHWRVSEVIGWNCIQRRNIALLEAIRLQPRYILTIDDDNAPTSARQVEKLVEIMNGQHDQAMAISTDTGWYNPGRHCITDEGNVVTHRGFPPSQRHTFTYSTKTPIVPIIGVAAMLWTGEPDIDAVERIAVQPSVTSVLLPNVILTPHTWAPFNTQATMFRGELAPAMFMWPHVGRYDDIWASYVTRAVMDQLEWGAYYGHPVVHQERNPHDLVKDLKAEIFGMEHNETIIKALQNTDVNMPYIRVTNMTVRLLTAAAKTNVLPHNTARSFECWIEDVGMISG